MTISTVYEPDIYNGDDSTDTFPITFAYLSTASYIKVSIKVTSTGVITEKVAGTHYNVTSDNVVFTGGNIPATGENIIIELSPDFKQQSDYNENDTFPAETLEDDLDKLCLQDQLNKSDFSRAILFDPTIDTDTTDLGVIPIPTSSGDKYLKLNAAADGWEFIKLSASSGLGNIVEDITPQLGGNLDLNSKNITGTGNVTVTGALSCTSSSSHLLSNSAAVNCTVIRSTGATPTGVLVLFNSTPNNTTQYFFACADGGAAGNPKAYIYSNGDLQNVYNAYGAISDIRVKQDVIDSSSQMEDIKNLKIKKYRLKDDVEKGIDKELLGVVAQDLISSGMGGCVKRNEDTGLYSVTYSVLYLKALKALQETISKVEELESRLSLLEEKSNVN